MITLREFIDCYLLGRNRLEAIELLPLGAAFDRAAALYGPPTESEPAEESPELTVHTFSAGKNHTVVATEWKGTVRSVTYWSCKAYPGRDLARLLEFYGEGQLWSVMEAGFWYQRADGVLRTWCSAAPAIGVASVEFLKARAEFKTAWQVAQLDNLKDPTWAPNDAIVDLQKRFVAKEDTLLLNFVQQSERIVASPDGRDLIIVRDHHASDDRDGFGEVNSPPDLTTGYSTQVLNFFHLGENSYWSKIPLPRDAVIEGLRCDGAVWRVTIRQTTTEKSLTFAGSFREIGLLGEDFRYRSPHKDEVMWTALEKIHREGMPRT
jgi:hypothetical protein